jgi:hypothetical protein
VVRSDVDKAGKRATGVDADDDHSPTSCTLATLLIS